MRFFPLLVVSLCFLSAGTKAASVAGATGNYDNDLGQLVGGSRAFATTSAICTELFPALSAQLSAAVEDWERRNRTTLNEINMRWQEHLKDLSGGSKDRELEITQKLASEAQDAERALRDYMNKLPNEQAKRTCAAIPEAMQAPDRDLENSMRGQLKSVRERPAK